MRLIQLKYLVDVAETKSITATSQRFYVTRQAVSNSIKQLEEEIGKELLVRKNNDVYLTGAGEEVLAFAQSVIISEEQLLVRLAAQEEAAAEIGRASCRERVLR